jgi:hypothetical protein
MALAFALGLGGLELGLRARGFAPSANDDVALWSAWRRAASPASRETVVILGKSRAQLGLDLEEARRRYPDLRFIQLAVHGRGAAAVLEDLSQDESFAGIVVWSLSEVDLTRQARAEQRPEVEAARADRSWDRPLDARASAWLESRLVALDRHASLQTLAFQSFEARQFWTMTPDRAQAADFAKADAAALAKINRDRRARDSDLAERFGGVKPRPWLEEAFEVEPWVRAIQGRGGDVVYLKFPACAEAEAFWDRWYPRATFWDALAARSSARFVHYRDAAGVFPLECPDTSHIDGRDRARVTGALLGAMERALAR